MSITRKSTSTALALTLALPALAAASPALADEFTSPAQVGASQASSIPPAVTPTLLGGAIGATTTTTTTTTIPTDSSFTEERFTGDDGVETIVRTRYIRTGGHTPVAPVRPHTGYPVQPMMHAPVIFERDQWLAECDRRTSGRSEREKGGIIGSLLGAAAGGVAGNLIAGTGERLAGTLIGAGTGGLAGLLLGSIIGGGKKGGKYDCEAALDSYISQYGQPGARHTVTYPYPPAGYGYMATGHYGYYGSCGCQAPQVVMVPIRTTVRQRLITRETTKIIYVPGEREIHPPKPHKPTKLQKVSPKMIKR